MARRRRGPTRARSARRLSPIHSPPRPPSITHSHGRGHHQKPDAAEHARHGAHRAGEAARARASCGVSPCVCFCRESEQGPTAPCPTRTRHDTTRQPTTTAHTSTGQHRQAGQRQHAHAQGQHREGALVRFMPCVRAVLHALLPPWWRLLSHGTHALNKQHTHHTAACRSRT